MLNISSLPRKLYNHELDLLFQILPENKSRYSDYRKLISRLYLIGTSRFGDGNYILAEENDEVDLTAPASAVFAAGIVKTNSAEYDITIHEIFENQIELDFISSINKKLDENEKIEFSKSYSFWKSGDLSPITKSAVREIHLIKNKVIIVISSSEKKIWLHEAETGFNYIIPLTNFYNEIARAKGDRNPEVALKPNLIFDKPELFSDKQIGQGFLIYNKFMKKINLDYSIFTRNEMKNKRTTFWKTLFGNSKND